MERLHLLLIGHGKSSVMVLVTMLAIEFWKSAMLLTVTIPWFAALSTVMIPWIAAVSKYAAAR
ncbi:hypothetical protein DFH27DRAFT_543000 [Peziza echinospora]|nr:hypothetical protein DFH27DRAFT_543000 [Peziza echinospora]